MHNVLEVDNLSVHYLTEKASVLACDDISFTLERGKILGIAGESGSGKSTLLMALMKLQRPPAITSGGSILLRLPDGSQIDLARAAEAEIKPHRWTVFSVVFQSAMVAFNPVMRVGYQFTDVIRQKYPDFSAAQARARAIHLMSLVGVTADRFTAYPHELSGGMRQRLTIALALACEPDLVVMDEPTTAVDVVMQRQILSQILELQRKLGFAVIFVTHDLTVLLELADDIAIMYGGRIVEKGRAGDIYFAPRHPYTKGLRDSFPPLHGEITTLAGIGGEPPDLSSPPPGCAFAPRCARRDARCDTNVPELETVGAGLCACFHRIEYAGGKAAHVAR